MLQNYSVVRNLADTAFSDSKFFGNPQVAKSKPQQSTLAFNPAPSPKVEKPQGYDAKNANGSVIDNGIEDAKKEDDGDTEVDNESRISEAEFKEPALKIKRSESSRDKMVQSVVADEDSWNETSEYLNSPRVCLPSSLWQHANGRNHT